MKINRFYFDVFYTKKITKMDQQLLLLGVCVDQRTETRILFKNTLRK